MQFTLKALRINKGYRQTDVAKMLNVCTSTILNWEQERQTQNIWLGKY